MPTGKARKSSVIEAKRQAALQQIVGELQGAFGDYVRSQMAAQPQGQPMPGAMPMAAPPPTPMPPPMMGGAMPPMPVAPPAMAPPPMPAPVGTGNPLLDFIMANQGRGVGPNPFDPQPIPVVMPPGVRY
jgi:hypothetical protein